MIGTDLSEGWRLPHLELEYRGARCGLFWAAVVAVIALPEPAEGASREWAHGPWRHGQASQADPFGKSFQLLPFSCRTLMWAVRREDAYYYDYARAGAFWVRSGGAAPRVF